MCTFDVRGAVLTASLLLQGKREAILVALLLYFRSVSRVLVHSKVTGS